MSPELQQLPRYQCHKVVRAGKIAAIDAANQTLVIELGPRGGARQDVARLDRPQPARCRWICGRVRRRLCVVLAGEGIRGRLHSDVRAVPARNLADTLPLWRVPPRPRHSPQPGLLGARSHRAALEARVVSISLPAGKRVRCIGCGKRINVSPAFTGRFADVRCKPCRSADPSPPEAPTNPSTRKTARSTCPTAGSASGSRSRDEGPALLQGSGEPHPVGSICCPIATSFLQSSLTRDRWSSGGPAEESPQTRAVEVLSDAKLETANQS